MTTATIATTPKHNSNHLLVHQWIRSAIRDSQQPTSPLSVLFLKLPPPPCAVLYWYLLYTLQILVRTSPYHIVHVKEPRVKLKQPLTRSFFGHSPSRIGRSVTSHYQFFFECVRYHRDIVTWKNMVKCVCVHILVGGLNPSEKILVNWDD